MRSAVWPKVKLLDAWVIAVDGTSHKADISCRNLTKVGIPNE